MTDRHAGYVVTLDRLDRQHALDLTKCSDRRLRVVVAYIALIADVTLTMAEARARHEVTMKVYGALG